MNGDGEGFAAEHEAMSRALHGILGTARSAELARELLHASTDARADEANAGRFSGTAAHEHMDRVDLLAVGLLEAVADEYDPEPFT